MDIEKAIKYLENLQCHASSEWECEALDLALATLRSMSEIGEPLTLEQLKQMNYLPVFVVTQNRGSGWCIVDWHGVKRSYMFFSRTGTAEGMSADVVRAVDYGIKWLSYSYPSEFFRKVENLENVERRKIK